jgi:hypothetical protein
LLDSGWLAERRGEEMMRVREERTMEEGIPAFIEVQGKLEVGKR